MRAPVLNRPLLLEERVRTPDGAGGFSDSWAVLGTLWAELRAGSGTERGKDFATLSQSKYRIYVRSAPHGAPSRPQPAHRFRDGARVFTILAVADADPAARFLVCQAVEEVAT